MRWADLFTEDVPQELLQEMQKQKETCDSIIAAKVRLVLGILVLGEVLARFPQYWGQVWELEE